MSSGFLLINKSSGPTSHDVIDQLRRITGIKKIGHAGTLDPFASGLLIVGVGRESTRQLDKFLKQDKEYVATLKLGFISDTFDRDGKIRVTRNKIQANSNNQFSISKQRIEEVLKKFKGEIEQVPPMYSAKKVQGKKLYELARLGQEIERQTNKITINKLEIKDYKPPQLIIECQVTSGTYIRSLAHDIGQDLGVGAFLQELQRTSIGPYKLSKAVDLSELNQENWAKYLKDLS